MPNLPELPSSLRQRGLWFRVSARLLRTIDESTAEKIMPWVLRYLGGEKAVNMSKQLKAEGVPAEQVEALKRELQALKKQVNAQS